MSDDMPKNQLLSETGSPRWLMPDFMAREVTSDYKWTYKSRVPVTQRLREQAALWMRTNHPFIASPSSAGIEAWLVALGVQCAGQMSADEAKMRAAAYVSTLAERPGYWFTRATLKAAAEKFKWFPSVAELVEFLKEQTQDREAQVEGARAIVNGPTQDVREVHMMEPLGVRLRAIAESYAKHYGAGDPRATRAKSAADDYDAR